MKKVFVLVISLAIQAGMYAADTKSLASSANKKMTSTISGKVTDKISGEPLAGVEIKLMDTEIKIYTDLDGNFEIADVSPGAHALQIAYISYQNIIENILCESSTTKTMTVKLKNVEK